MNRGMVDLKELRANFDKADFKHGKSSYCFIIGDKIYKIFAKKYGNPEMPKNQCDLSMYQADTIMFPLEYIYEYNQSVGEISQYIANKSIMDSFNATAIISRILESYDEVVGDLMMFPDIYMQDICGVNILFSNELGFHIIDTTDWIKSKNMFSVNLSKFNVSLIGEIFEYTDISIIYGRFANTVDHRIKEMASKFGTAGERLKESLKLIEYRKYNFIKFIEALMYCYRIYSGNDPKTLGEIKEFVKVMKKG